MTTKKTYKLLVEAIANAIYQYKKGMHLNNFMEGANEVEFQITHKLRSENPRFSYEKWEAYKNKLLSDV